MKAEEFSERLWDFAARVGNLVDSLPTTRLGKHIAGQLIRSGTSPAPNYDEACSAESKADFAHKVGIATKEMRETYGWLRFIVRAKVLPPAKLDSLIDESEQLLKMLSKSRSTARLSNSFQSKIPNPQSPVPSHIPGHTGLDHLAIAVPSTSEALALWHDTLGFEIVCSEIVNNGTVKLTHLDLGNTHLQLVEPMTPDHPLHAWLAANGSGLHHFCLRVDDIDETMAASPIPTAPAPHQGTQGKRALFFDKSATQNILLEATGR